MALTVRITDIPSSRLQAQLEALIRECIGPRPEWEDWKVLAQGPSSGAAGYCWLTVEAPGQKRQRVFYDQGDKLIEEIRAWFNLYPFR